MNQIKANIRSLLETDPTYSSLLPKEFSDDFDLIQGGVLDSIGLMNFVFFLEEQFSITVDMEDLQSSNFQNLNAISSWVAQKLHEHKERKVP